MRALELTLDSETYKLHKPVIYAYGVEDNLILEYIGDNFPDQKEKILKLADEIVESKNKMENQDLKRVKEEIKTFLLMKDSRSATEAAVRFIEETEHVYTIRSDIKTNMWIYKDGIYVPEGKSYVKQIIRDLLDVGYNIFLDNEIIHKLEVDTFIDEYEFMKIADPYEVPIKNGILNIVTREVSPFSPEKIHFTKLNCEYKEGATCPAIKQFFSEIVDEESVLVIQELFGYCLLRDYKFEKAFMFTGNGRNGKGKTLELLKTFLGPKVCSATPLKRLCDENAFDIDSLFGKMVNIGGDISDEGLKETGPFKSLTGHDEITVKRKFNTPLTFVNFAKFIFSANTIPRTKDLTDAFFNRWIILDFKYQFRLQKEYDVICQQHEEGTISDADFKLYKLADPSKIKKITSEKELDGLLIWALDGLQRLLETGDFSSKNTTEMVRDIWIRKSDSFMAFCMDCIGEDYDSYVIKKDLSAAYSQYCKRLDLKPCSSSWVKSVLEGNYGASSAQRNLDDERPHVWTNIKLLKPYLAGKLEMKNE
jgi:putative DNA primase/helicase